MSSVVAAVVMLCCLFNPTAALPQPSSNAASSDLPMIQAAPSQTCSIYGSGQLNCYEGPSESYTAAATVNGGHYYTCSCQAAGETINGNANGGTDSSDRNWDFIPDDALPGGGCYVNQYFTTAPCTKSTLPKC